MLGFIQQLQLLHHDLDLTGGDVFVHGALVTTAHPANGCHHKLRTQAAGFLMDGGILAFVKNKLRHSSAVPQINKNHVAKITAPVDPAHQNNLFAGMVDAKLPTSMGTTKIT